MEFKRKLRKKVFMLELFILEKKISYDTTIAVILLYFSRPIFATNIQPFCTNTEAWKLLGKELVDEPFDKILYCKSFHREKCSKRREEEEKKEEEEERLKG